MEDTLELFNQKSFLGQEFLTWLWFLSEQDEPVSLGSENQVFIYLGGSITLGPALGAEGSRVSVKGDDATLAEAREGLRRGKLVESIRLGVVMGDNEFWMTLNSKGLDVASLKLPPVARDEDEAPESHLLERVYLIETALGLLDALFEHFIRARLEDGKGGELWRRVREWAAPEVAETEKAA